MNDNNIIIYAEGFVNCSVCVLKEITPLEVEREINLRSPTGISNGWSITQEYFSTGEPNPCPCDTDPETRVHYLLCC